ncbi:MAG: hypothetical protein K1X86_11855 [Ignavibacteria bacterium]|nr:hypothetical protein [Ignavibacteria bacterium]
MGSIRAVTNSANEVISAYDYDAWGYKLREWKSGDDAKFRFTGKERDNETGYDYFGARYYDSRIGRWGGMEPKYDKYIGLSPYSYAYNSSLKIIDVDGKDGRVVIDNSAKTITFYNVNFYTKNDKYPFALNNTKENRLEDYIAQGNEKWNEAAKGNKFSGYDVKFVFSKEKIAGNVNALLDNDFGANIVMSEKVRMVEGKEKKNVPAAVSGNTLIIYDYGNNHGEDAKRTGAHELGHQNGLPDLYTGDRNIMFWIDSWQADPTKEDVQKIVDQLDLSKETQIIRSAKKTSE